MAQIEQPTINLEEIIGDLEKRIERLKILYEQFFLGNQRAEPLVARKECTRKIVELQQINIRNTGLRFRFNTLVQRWNVYQSYWGRILRKIELGTFVRDVQRAKRNMARRGRLAEDVVAEGSEGSAAAEAAAEAYDGADAPGTNPNLTPWTGSSDSGELEALSDDDLMPMEEEAPAAVMETFTSGPVMTSPAASRLAQAAARIAQAVGQQGRPPASGGGVPSAAERTAAQPFRPSVGAPRNVSLDGGASAAQAAPTGEGFASLFEAAPRPLAQAAPTAFVSPPARSARFVPSASAAAARPVASPAGAAPAAQSPTGPAVAPGAARFAPGSAPTARPAQFVPGGSAAQPATGTAPTSRAAPLAAGTASVAPRPGQSAPGAPVPGAPASVRAPAAAEGPPRPARPAPAGAVPDPIPGVSFDDLRAAYERYRDARRSTGESEVRYADMVESLTQKVPSMLERTGFEKVKIDVDVKDGKAVLRVKPKRG